MTEHTHEGFSSVDGTGDASPFVAYLDEADRNPFILQMRAAMFECVAPTRDDVLLDVGCGTGTALFELAPLVARAVGVDLSEEMLAVARSRAPAGVELLRADATALPFDDAAFDVYRAERIYQHLDDPAPALAEARRVLRRGGRLVVADPDWGGLVVDLDDDAPLRRAVDASLAVRPGATVARALRRRVLEAGFGDVETVSLLATLTERESAIRLLLTGLVFTDAAREAVGADALDALRVELEAREPFLAAVPVFIAVARRLD